MLVFLALPLAALIYRAAPGEIWRNLAMPQVRQAITLSLSTTLISTALIVIFGTPLAYLLAKGRIPLRQVVDSLVDLPAVLPPAVAGVALLITFGRRGVLGGFLAEWDIYIAFTSVAVVMAQVFVASPFFIKAATAGFAAIDPELEQAAALDGADGWQIFRHVTAPLAWNGMVGGAVMAWARALGRVWGHHHLCRQLSRPHPDHAPGHLHRLRAGPERSPHPGRDPDGRGLFGAAGGEGAAGPGFGDHAGNLTAENFPGIVLHCSTLSVFHPDWIRFHGFSTDPSLLLHLSLAEAA